MGGLPTPDDRDPAPGASPATWRVGIGSLLFATFVFRLSQTRADPDLWGHLRFGDDLLRTGRPVRADTYSYLTGDRPWVNHEWLAEGIMALVYRAGGAPALVGLKVLLGTALIAVLTLHLTRRGLSGLGAALLVAYAMLLVLPGFESLRPQLWTYVLFALLLMLTDRAEEGATGWLWAGVPLFALWANLHGGVLAGIGVVGVWVAAHLAWCERGWRTEAWRVLPPAAGMVLASLANPYGAGLWTFLLGTAVGPRRDISEWRPVELTSVEGAIYLVALAVGIGGLAGSRRPRSPAQVAVFACAAVLPLLARRHAALFAIAGVAVAGEHVADVSVRLARRFCPRGQRPMRDRRAMIGWLLIGQAAVLLWLAAPHFRRVDVDPRVYPARAVALLRASGVEGHLAVFYDWGEYVLWHLGPRIKVSVDGRRETVYSDGIYRENLRFADGTGEWNSLLRSHDTHLVLVPRGLPVWNLMKLEPGWTLLDEDAVSALFGRRDWAPLGRIQAAKPGVSPAPETPRPFP
ncbi:MAG TPA: hypothetical protein VEL75_20590 [Candidatus Methylomirabilis sp.]|nr:hypothetical protein [Candidatus Methylomirabilis sp.]